MIRSLNLDQLGSRIELIDEFILILMAHRMRLSLNVAAFKGSSTPPLPIYREDKENERLLKAMEIGKKLGLKKNFVFSMLYNLIGESCKEQMIELQGKFKPLPNIQDDEWFDVMRGNLLTLTEAIAPIYDNEYDGEFFASRQYKNFEERVLTQEIDMLAPEDLAIDLGCATGEKTFRLADNFKKVIGYDLSLDMISQANNKLNPKLAKRISFQNVDLENGIPLPDNSVSFVNMNLGTASDIKNIGNLIKEVERVLVPGGGFLFSFYNADALVYKWDFLPWPLSVAAEINREKQCLDVHSNGEVFSVPAISYKIEEIKGLFPIGLNLIEIKTYPTLGSILPNRLFKSEEVKQTIIGVDEELSSIGLGAYALALGIKN